LNYEKLSRSYEMGYEQGKRELSKWKEFLYHPVVEGQHK